MFSLWRFEEKTGPPAEQEIDDVIAKIKRHGTRDLTDREAWIHSNFCPYVVREADVHSTPVQRKEE